MVSTVTPVPSKFALAAFPSAVSSANTSTVEPSAPTDHELMLAVRSGEIARLGELFERHHGPLFGFFVRMTGQHATSEDLVQMVFYRILKYRHTYRDEGKFSAWMYHLARKVAADHFRKQSHPSFPSASDPTDLHEHPDPALAPGEQAAVNDDLEIMRTALSRLPLDQREVITLYRFQNLRHEEIAQLLDCSVGAVKVRVHRAISALRDRFSKLRRESAA